MCPDSLGHWPAMSLPRAGAEWERLRMLRDADQDIAAQPPRPAGCGSNAGRSAGRMSRRRRPCGRYATASWTYETPTARSAPDDPGFSPVRTGAGARNRARLAAGDHRTGCRRCRTGRSCRTGGCVCRQRSFDGNCGRGTACASSGAPELSSGDGCDRGPCRCGRMLSSGAHARCPGLCTPANGQDPRG